jgi:L-asparaginase II
MTLPGYQPVLEIRRGRCGGPQEIIESLHYGAIAVVDASGRLYASFGDPAAVTFLRSSAKPFQALPFVERGGPQQYGLSENELALVCASHSGTDEHVQVAAQIQQKTGVSEAELLCGVHLPSHRPTLEALRQSGAPLTPNRHNCSGKHSGMLALARLLSIHSDLPYTDPAHPVQRLILAAFADLCGLAEDQVVLGIDGCSVPTFGAPLYAAARGYARLCDPQAGGVTPPERAEACREIVHAMISHPGMVGGPDSFDTHLMQTAEGRILCKGGAEGFMALGLLPETIGPGSPALGIAIKISDGDLAGHSRPAGDPGGHARPAVALETLRQLGALNTAELAQLADYGPEFPIHNWRKLDVGQGRPCFTLTFASAAAAETPHA